jgi:hypothetical protein
MGGAGGVQGGKGGNAAPGGLATATATARGAGGEATASAAAGNGGSGGTGGAAQPKVSLVGQMIVGGKGGDGAKGGNATAKATAMDGPIALATATGGAGGSAGMGGPGKTKDGAFGGAGDGGTADATASATNSTGNALAVSQASGGNGGLLQPGTKNTVRATPGNAMATATANAPNGDATADPTAINGHGNGGTATATGMATGKGDAAIPQARTATSSTRLKTSINNLVNSPIPVGGAGKVNAEAVVGNAAPLPALKPNLTLASGLLALGFNFELTAHTPGEGFASDLAVASIVPEPPSPLLLLIGFAAVLGLVVRRGSMTAAAGHAGSS